MTETPDLFPALETAPFPILTPLITRRSPR